MEKKIAAVVVTYNRKDLLTENIQCLLAQEPIKPDILIIDNHSTDGTKEVIQEYIDAGKIQYYDTGSNQGGAGGFSFGIRCAVEKEYDYIWVMDDDCMPKQDALSAFISADRQLNGDYGFLSSKVLWKDGSICKMNIQRRTLTKPLKGFDEKIQSVVMASFVSLFLSVKVIREMGLPIKEFFIWTDDWEYTRRISRKYSCYAVADSVVVHKSKSNTGANIAIEDSSRLDRFSYLYRNDVYLYRREGIKGFCYELIRLMDHLMRVLFKSKNNKWKRIKKIISGTKAGLRFRPVIEYMEGNHT